MRKGAQCRHLERTTTLIGTAARAYEELMDLVEDLELGRIADARLEDGQEPLRVSLDTL
jgi:hypothetical protein